MMTKKKWIAYCLFVFIAVTHTAFSQIQNIGKIVSYKKIAGGIEGKTATHIFDVRAYAEHTIRVRISKNKTFNTVCYALADHKMPVYENIKIVDKENKIQLSTNAIDMEIEKTPCLRVVFKNKKGVVINEDMTGEFLGTTFLGEKVTIYKKIQTDERFVGLGEALGNLDRRATGVWLNNTDTYKYGDVRLPMYSSVPFYIGLHHNTVYGLFFNNTFKSFLNFGLSTQNFSSVTMDGGDADYFFMYDSSVANIIEHYSRLTGTMPLPPKWSIGYQQSRCTYFPQSRVEWIAESFRKKNIPIDGIVLDADYQQNYQPFRTNTARFPDMRGLANKFANMNIELTASVYPGVEIDSTYFSYTDGLEKDIFLKNADGSLFQTEIAPLKVHLPDYTNPKARAWWIEKMEWMKHNGISGYWNDMNEPAVGGSYLPDNVVFDFDGRKANADEAKNVYGFQMARSSYEAGLKNLEGKRAFVLSRSGFAGIQRYASVWSGDNTASDEGLLSGVLLNMQMGLSGMPFVGPDLSGYIGDGNKDLFRRWMQVGIFSPYVRNHKGMSTLSNEPWSYGEEVEAISKNYIQFRYRLLPYLYSKFFEASQTGMPIARSLCIYYPFDSKVYEGIYQYQFLFGDAIMVVPITTQESIKKIYLPQGDWYNLFNDEISSGNKELLKEVPSHQIPLFAKASSIIPVQSQTQSTKDKTSDTLQIHIYNGKERNTFVYYEDDGSTFEYKKGTFLKRTIVFDPSQKQIVLSAQEGKFNSAFKQLQFIFHGFGSDVQNIRIANNTIQVQESNIKIFNPLEGLSEYYAPDFYKQLAANEIMPTQKSITISNTTQEILIKW